VLKRLQREYRERPILVEGFVVFLAMAALVIAGELTVFALQARMAVNGVPFNSPVTWLDAYIPFSPVWAWPYWAYYGVLAAAIWLPRNRFELLRLAVGFTFVNFLAYAFFLGYPTVMERPSLEGCESISCGLVGGIYLLDPGYAIFPSLHVANSIYVAIWFFLFKHPARWPVMLVALAITASAVLIKQHYIIDLPAGVLLAFTGILVAWPTVDWLANRNRAVKAFQKELIS
jgi:membrane-associated phospholipid phosphatase